MSWKDDLPEDLRSLDTLKDIEDVNSLAKQFVDQSRYLGNSIRIPGEDASDEDRAAFRAKLVEKHTGLVELPVDPEDEEGYAKVFDALGRPQKPDEYELPTIDGVELDKERTKRFAEAAHAAGMTKKQFGKVMGEIFKADAELLESKKGEHTTAMTALRAEWGDAFEGKLNRAAKVAELTNAPEGLVEAIRNGDTDTATLRWLDGLSTSLGGEAAELVKQAGGSSGITPMEAREKADEILRAMDKIPQGDPRYQELMQKRVQYMQMASKKSA